MTKALYIEGILPKGPYLPYVSMAGSRQEEFLEKYDYIVTHGSFNA